MRLARSIARGPDAARQGSGDGGDQLVLNGEDVVERPVVALGPNVVAGRGIDELGGDAHPPAHLPHAALQEIADIQPAPEFEGVQGLVAEGERGVARQHAQVAKAREGGEEVLGDAVAEVGLIDVTAQVVKG